MNENEINLVSKIILHTAIYDDFSAVSKNGNDIYSLLNKEKTLLNTWGITFNQSYGDRQNGIHYAITIKHGGDLIEVEIYRRDNFTYTVHNYEMGHE